MFLEKRVYQGSSGKVYPLPFVDRISEDKADREWDAVHLENEFVRLMILPEIGGRIHVGLDKTNDYDFFYRQRVIKPALVGLAGPWISGGVEFNWPQHHRPSTFMPAEVHLEEHPDGSKTVWLSEHEPMNRMKGMHGVCLHPGKSVVELKVRLYNRTPFVQTFLWWANVAVRVHDEYQSFFPPDVFYVADHAKRAMSEFPDCKGFYYGVDYRPATGLDWYKNIPVPTSYMAMGSSEDFFGGYDHGKEAGLVHIASHHISPGKKQWTWGNHEFGYAWDRNLTDEDGPYVELMAGVYTDNQPDFSFLQPGETKTYSQFWYPIREIGPAQYANLDAAVSLRRSEGENSINVGVSVTSDIPNAEIRLFCQNDPVATYRRDLSPGSPLTETVPIPAGIEDSDLRLQVTNANGATIIEYAPRSNEKGAVPPPATEPLAPADIASADELYITGLHLEQYRHATREPVLYWREALRRDPGDSRCNNAIGLWHLRRGEVDVAKKHFETSIARITLRNPNPRDGEPYYNLGLAHRMKGDLDLAYTALYKATWNEAWKSAAFHALAEIDCVRGQWSKAAEHLVRSLAVNTENLKARNLMALALKRLGHEEDAKAVLQETLALDPLDQWARHIANRPLNCDSQTRLDIALDYARAGFYESALDVLADAIAEPGSGSGPLIDYYRGYFHAALDDGDNALECFRRASTASPDYCFPHRLEEIAILEAAIAANPSDARAPYYLGNLYYDRRRYDEAIHLWEQSTALDPSFSIPWRNLGIAYFNVRQKPQRARAAYEKAFEANPSDARLLHERDQLWKRIGISPKVRLRELESRRDLVDKRDDLTVELCALYNRTGKYEKAHEIVTSRHFQPWEGGEGQALGQYVRSNLNLGRRALLERVAEKAQTYFEAALKSPVNLGEAKHLLANQADIYYWLGEVSAIRGETAAAQQYWAQSAAQRGDFQDMAVKSHSEMTYYQALSLGSLGKRREANRLLSDLKDYACSLLDTEAKIDYFATSLPTMLLFDDDLQKRQAITAKFLLAQAALGLGNVSDAERWLQEVLEADPNHALAAEFAETINFSRA
jgi:tetratricopeptide (TPR) repeat protein